MCDDCVPHGTCIYCGRAVMQGAEHDQDCAMVTKIYPVLKQDVEPYGMACCECNVSLKLGDSYTTLTIEEGGTPIVETVCLMCGVKGKVTG